MIRAERSMRQLLLLMEEFISLVLIVFGILQIILFFKIWGMTSDVANILRIIKANETKTIDTYMIKDLVSMGKESQAEGVVFEIADKFCSDIAEIKISRYEALERYLALEKLYKELGKEMPEYIVGIIDELFKTKKN